MLSYIRKKYSYHKCKKRLLSEGWVHDKFSGFWLKESGMMAVENCLLFDDYKHFLTEEYYVKIIYGWKVYTIKKANTDILKTHFQRIISKMYPRLAMLFAFAPPGTVLTPIPKKWLNIKSNKGPSFKGE